MRDSAAGHSATYRHLGKKGDRIWTSVQRTWHSRLSSQSPQSPCSSPSL